MATLAMNRFVANTDATAAAQNANCDIVEAVVNALDADNLAADSVQAVALNPDVVRADKGLSQHTDGTLQVDVSDTNPCLELSDGGLRAKVYGVINRTSDGLTWGRTGDVIFSSSASTPDGFTDVSATYEGKMVRVSATALSTGGADTHTHGGVTGGHSLTEAELASHRHTLEGHYSANGSRVANAAHSSAGAAETTCTADAMGLTGSGDAHTHTISSGDNVPAYITLRAYSKV
jgi:hypothetical protein